MCQITPPPQRCRSEARTSTTPLHTTVASLPSKGAMACVKPTAASKSTAAAPNPKSRTFMDKSPSVDVARGGKRRKRTATTEEDAPIKNGSSMHKYHEVIRNKEERAKMTGVDCPECRDFLKMMEKQGLITDRQVVSFSSSTPKYSLVVTSFTLLPPNH
eukprot:403191_1